MKIGKVVTMTACNLISFNPPTVAGRYSTKAFLPARFRPASAATVYSRCPVTVVNGGPSAETGSLGHSAGGIGNIFVYAHGGDFGATGERSVLPFHVSWVTD